MANLGFWFHIPIPNLSIPRRVLIGWWQLKPCRGKMINKASQLLYMAMAQVPFSVTGNLIQAYTPVKLWE